MASLSVFLCMGVTFSLCFHGISAIDYQVNLLSPESPSGTSFTKEIGIPYTKELMGKINEFLFSTIYQQNDQSTRKPVSSVIVNIDEYKDYMSNDLGNVVNISSTVIEGFKADMKWHFTGIMYHEMAHVFQWTGEGHAPVGLLEGIAEYARIKANYIASDFAKPGDGSKWDEGYSTTARFLEYCDGITSGFVAKLNEKLKSPYDVKFFNNLAGKPVEQLWQDYKAKYGH